MKKFLSVTSIVLVLLCLIVAFFGFKKYEDIKFQAYKLIDYNPQLTTQIFDRNGKLVANYFEDENRLYAKYSEIPPRLIEALVAIEDTVFFEHDGINFEAIFRATFKNIQSMGYREGASTITQQIVKNTVLTREKTLERKFNEAILSFIIENELSKEDILERYLNHIYFGHGYYGVRTASEGYFHKTLPMLTLKEMAMLVGMPKSPNAFDPTKNLSASISRGNVVLLRMKDIGWITEEEYANAVMEVPTIFNDTLTKNQAPYVTDEVVKRAGEYFGDLKSGGYQIYLGIDLDVQVLAEEALVFGYNEILKRANNDTNTSLLNGAMVVLDNHNGDILALVGGVNHTVSHFNRAVSSNRQTGSSFKPFIYQIALNLGYSTMSTIPDISRVYSDDNSEDENSTWAPKNIEGNFQGLITLKDAITRSRNLATINLVTTMGLDVVHKELTNMGFKNIPQDLSIALGSAGVSPLEYGKFFGMFANGGELVEPLLIKKIVNRYGHEKVFESSKRQIFDNAQTYLMVDMLKNVVEKGTGRSARVAGIEIAGKTGTTNNNVDAWFSGFTPDINVMVWYGNDNNLPMQKSEVGGRTSTVPFAYFMKKYIETFPETTRTFKVPENVYKGLYQGREEYFTKTSPFPHATQIQDNSEGLIF
ncbi:MAG: penicillin-binding protein 1A [Campylobacteraceae bacterium]